ncbi:MAG: hypothetical protein K0S93_73 [Nitrososphaeraceae archaeon]|jgi:hypothetical protein|nr:hypothetical protein [Nitrososphaeraceae archaeon]
MWINDYSDNDRDTCLLCGEDLLYSEDDLFCKAECKQEYKHRYNAFLTIR